MMLRGGFGTCVPSRNAVLASWSPARLPLPMAMCSTTSVASRVDRRHVSLAQVLLREHDAALFEESIAWARNCRMSVANALEATMVVEGRGGQAAGEDLDGFLEHGVVSGGQPRGGAQLRRLLRLCPCERRR